MAGVVKGPILDPELEADLRRRAKIALRKRYRALRASVPAPARLIRSQRICEFAAQLEAFRAARSVALYWPVADSGEVDLGGLDALAREQGKQVYYPCMAPIDGGFSTGFRATDNVEQLQLRGQKFCEPEPTAALATRDDIDLVFVPALAIDPRGYRLGFGSGFYDVTLPDHCPPASTVAVVFDFQMVGELPNEPHDVLIDSWVTDRGSYLRAES